MAYKYDDDDDDVGVFGCCCYFMTFECTPPESFIYFLYIGIYIVYHKHICTPLTFTCNKKRNFNYL